MMDTCSRGREGEEKAVRYLAEAGYTISGRNYRNRTGEIDIIAEKEDELVFIEVKYLCGYDGMHLEDLVNEKKRSRIIRTARSYLFEKGKEEEMRLRFDVILCERYTNTITHYKDAFTESGII